MKTRLGMVLSAFTLMMCVGCALMKSDEERNEVTGRYYWVTSDGWSVTNIEQANVSTNNAVKTSDVYVTCYPFIQVYRIEDRKVFNCRWTGRLNDWDWKESTTIENTWAAMFEVFEQLPNSLGQSEKPPKPLASSPVVTVTTMGWSAFATPSSEAFTWSRWTALQWAGVSDEVPSEIETFRQTVEQVLFAPEYKKKYRSYLRAVPLFTDADYDAEKDTPWIDFKNTRYHARNAMQYPYLLIPISGWGSPFPTAKKYTPGDRFKVCDGERYFVIETFEGDR